MAGFAHCSIEARQHLEDLSDADLKAIEKELKQRAKVKRAANQGATADEAFRAAADEVNKKAELEAAKEARNRLLNLRKRVENMRYLSRVWADDPTRGLEALLVGVNQAREGSRFSVSAEQKMLSQSYQQGLMADLMQAELWDQFKSGTIDLDVARALFRGVDGDMAGLPKDAVRMAKIISQWQELMRREANEAGAWIGKLEGRVSLQSHDMFRLRKASKILGGIATPDEAANRAAWKAYVLDRLDHEKTFEAIDDIDGFLDSTYEALASGLHLQHAGEPGAIKGKTGFGARVSHDRKLHFKDAESWLEYDQTFGSGSLRESILHDMTRHGHNTAIMRMMGPNAEDTFRQLVDHAKRLSAKGGVSGRSAIKQADDAKRFDTWWAHLTGEANVPGNMMAARVGMMVRALQSMAKLGGALLSSVADVAFVSAELKYQGFGFLDRWSTSLRGVFKGRGGAERQQLLAGLGILADGMRASAARRFMAEDNIPGAMSSALQTFFRWNGLTWWTDTLRADAAVAMSNNMAMNASKAFNKLDGGLARALDLFGIDADMWDIARKRFVSEAEGRKLILPEMARDLDDATITGYLKAHADTKLLRKGEAEPSAREIREMRDEFERKFKAFFSDRADYAVIEPDTRIRALMLGDNRPGTVTGEIYRYFWQFKSFPMAVIDKAVGREVFGRGDQSGRFIQAMRGRNGELQGLASMMTASMVFGYMAMSLKDLAKGREPRIPDSLLQASKIFAAAMVQGGGAGLYGDFLFGDWRTRYGGGFVSASLGPTAGSIDDIRDLVGRIWNGDKAAARSFKVALSHAPFANLFYTRMALDYAILYDIQEQLSPGYLARMETRLKKDNDQEFLDWGPFPGRPSQNRLRPFTE